MSIVDLFPWGLSLLVGCLLAGVHSTEGLLTMVTWYFIGHFLTTVILFVLGRLLDVRYWFLSDFPSCENGCCKNASDYTYVGPGNVIPSGIFRCKCGTEYLFDGYSMKRILTSGETVLIAIREGRFFFRWRRVHSKIDDTCRPESSKSRV